MRSIYSNAAAMIALQGLAASTHSEMQALAVLQQQIDAPDLAPIASAVSDNFASQYVRQAHAKLTDADRARIAHAEQKRARKLAKSAKP